MKKIFFSFLLVVLNLGVATSPVSALSCMYMSPETHVSSAQVLFVGTVTNLNEVNAIGTGTIYPPQISKDKEKSYATFSVEKYWKTNPGSTVNVYNIYPWTGYVGNEQSFFKVGQKYIVYASNSNGKISATIDCGRTSTYSDSHYNEIVGYVGQPNMSPVNPIFPNPDTNKCAYTNINSDLWYGNYFNNKADVLTLQNFLFRHFDVLDDINPNGFFGKLTRSYVTQFQKETGIRATGGVGSLTRAKIKEVCGQGGTVSCTEEYAPVCGQPNFSCPAGSFCTQQMPAPKTYSNKCKMNAEGAKYLYEGKCKSDIVSDGQAPSSCKVWYDGCNTCSRQYEGGPMACTLMACLNTTNNLGFANNGAYCKEYFSSNSVAPTIKSFSGPTVLQVGQKGTWSIDASMSNNQQLSYKITWGDEMNFKNVLTSSSIMFNTPVVQNSTFEHTYTTPGRYTVNIVVTASNGQSSKTTTTVTVNPLTSSQGCYIGATIYPEGTSKSSLPDSCVRNATSPCSSDAIQSVMDASFVCRSGYWKIEGSLPTLRY
jgi:hypothetical protein